MNAPAMPPLPTAACVDLRNPIKRRLDASGTELPDDVTDGHVMTHFPQLGLIFDIRKPTEVGSLAAAHQHAASIDLLGRTGEWVVGEDVEIAALIDRRFKEPTVDPRYAPNMPAYDWIYTATKYSGSSDHVWFVSLLDGSVYWYSDDGNGLVVPVLRVPASQ